MESVRYMFWRCRSLTNEPHQSSKTFSLRNSTVCEVCPGLDGPSAHNDKFQRVKTWHEKTHTKSYFRERPDACLSTMMPLMCLKWGWWHSSVLFAVLIRWDYCYNTEVLSFTHFKEITASQHASSRFKLLIHRHVSVHVAAVFRQCGGTAW